MKFLKVPFLGMPHISGRPPPKKKNVVLFMHPITSDCSTSSKKCLDFTPLLLFLVLKFPMFIWGINLPAYIYTLRYVTLRYVTLHYCITLRYTPLHCIHYIHDMTWHDMTVTFTFTLAFVFVFAFACIHVCMYVCMYVCIYIYMWVCRPPCSLSPYPKI